MKAFRKGVLPRLIAGSAVIAMSTATLASGGVTQAAAASKVTISVAYAANTTFDTTPLGLTWWTSVKAQYEKLYPDVKVNLVAVQGGEHREVGEDDEQHGDVGESLCEAVGV